MAKEESSFADFHSQLFAGLGIKSDKCYACKKSVYAAERVLVNGNIFHNACLRCTQCRTVLSFKNLSQAHGKFYCSRHVLQQLGKVRGSVFVSVKQADDGTLQDSRADTLTRDLGTCDENLKQLEITFDTVYEYDVEVVNFMAINAEEQLFPSEFKFMKKSVSRKGFLLQTLRNGEGEGWEPNLVVQFTVVPQKFALDVATKTLAKRSIATAKLRDDKANGIAVDEAEHLHSVAAEVDIEAIIKGYRKPKKKIAEPKPKPKPEAPVEKQTPEPETPTPEAHGASIDALVAEQRKKKQNAPANELNNAALQVQKMRARAEAKRVKAAEEQRKKQKQLDAKEQERVRKEQEAAEQAKLDEAAALRAARYAARIAAGTALERLVGVSAHAIKYINFMFDKPFAEAREILQIEVVDGAGACAFEFKAKNCTKRGFTLSSKNLSGAGWNTKLKVRFVAALLASKDEQLLDALEAPQAEESTASAAPVTTVQTAPSSQPKPAPIKVEEVKTPLSPINQLAQRMDAAEDDGFTGFMYVANSKDKTKHQHSDKVVIEGMLKKQSKTHSWVWQTRYFVLFQGLAGESAVFAIYQGQLEYKCGKEANKLILVDDIKTVEFTDSGCISLTMRASMRGMQLGGEPEEVQAWIDAFQSVRQVTSIVTLASPRAQQKKLPVTKKIDQSKPVVQAPASIVDDTAPSNAEESIEERIKRFKKQRSGAMGAVRRFRVTPTHVGFRVFSPAASPATSPATTHSTLLPSSAPADTPAPPSAPVDDAQKENEEKERRAEEREAKKREAKEKEAKEREAKKREAKERIDRERAAEKERQQREAEKQAAKEREEREQAENEKKAEEEAQAVLKPDVDADTGPSPEEAEKALEKSRKHAELLAKEEAERKEREEKALAKEAKRAKAKAEREAMNVAKRKAAEARKELAAKAREEMGARNTPAKARGGAVIAPGLMGLARAAPAKVGFSMPEGNGPSGRFRARTLAIKKYSVMPSNAGEVVAIEGDLTDVCMLFDAFKDANDLYLINETFSLMRDESMRLCNAEDNDISAFEAMNRATGSQYKYKRWWKMILKRKQTPWYKMKPLKDQTTVVVGGGPAGLRVAIELALLGSVVYCVDKRMAFNRNNILHIWDGTIRDLKGLGASYFLKDFATGAINHVSIRELQCVLLKVCLAVGVRFVYGCTYKGFTAPTSSGKRYMVKIEDTRKVKNTDDCNDENIDELKEEFGNMDDDTWEIPTDILLSAAGPNSPILAEAGIQSLVFKGSQSIGVTANFLNTNTPEEKTLPEFTCSKVYNQGFFQNLEDSYSLETENLVYFHGNFTHYLVMTPKKASLLTKGVFKENLGRAVDCCSADNVDAAQLEQLCREVADELGIPKDVIWAKNFRGNRDVAIFDFSMRKVAAEPAILLEAHGARLAVGLVGDSLLEPFWPMGTGANKAILSALDTAWMCMAYGLDTDNWSKAVMMRKACFGAMKHALPSALPVPGNCATNLDPTQRYHKTELGI